jgi:hypothetical protein
MPTSSTTDAVLRRLDALITEGEAVPKDREDRFYVESAPMVAWRTRCVAFLNRTLGDSDTYTQEFKVQAPDTYLGSRDRGVAILKNLRGDVEGGYLTNYYLGVAGEVLADLLDLGSWSLGEGSKEAAAILVGSGLEVGLRRVAAARSIDISNVRGIDGINEALSRAGIYGAVRRGQVDAWRVLRNHAIHGEHEAYSDAEVRLMLDGVQAFLAEQLA